MIPSSALSESKESSSRQTAVLNLAGVVPFSTVDWPGKIAASVFAQGCPFRCHYCHNHEILDPKVEGGASWQDVLDLLPRRKGLLDGVVFSGGEVLLQAIPPRGSKGVEDSPLGVALKQVKDLGFETGLHSSGSHPNLLRQLLETGLVDWVGLDIKAMPDDYEYITGSPIGGKKAEASLAALIDHPEVSHEVRMTLWPGILRAPSVPFSENLVDPKDGGDYLLDYAIDIADWSFERGAKRFALQRFQDTAAKEGSKGDNIPTVTWDDAEACFRLQQIGFESVQVR